MEKTRQYYDTIQEGINMMFRLPFKEYYPEMPTYDVIQSYEGKLLKLDINDVMFEVKENDALRETEAKFHFLLGYKTDNWLNPEPSVMYNQDAIRQRLIVEGYDDKKIESYLSQIYKVQCTVMERIEFARRMIDYMTNAGTYKD